MADSEQPEAVPGAKIRAADSLPPVEPPDPKLILKLFFVPGLIVFIVVMLVLGVTALVNLGSNPLQRLEAIERGAGNAWQEAESIATELRSSPELRSNVEFNQRMAAFLERRLQAPLPADEKELDAEVLLRYFLCKCLGEFDIADGFPVLAQAAQPPEVGEDDTMRDVRLAAIEAVALLIENVRAAGNPLPAEQVFEFLDARSREGGASDTERGPIRARASFALGALGGEQATARLTEMLTLEFYPDARFNAATGLARWGNPACLETLEEMIDPETTEPLLFEKVEEARDLKRWTIQINGVKGAELLARQNAECDLTPLKPALTRLRAVPDLPAAIDQEAKQLELIIGQRSP